MIHSPLRQPRSGRGVCRCTTPNPSSSRVKKRLRAGLAAAKAQLDAAEQGLLGMVLE